MSNNRPVVFDYCIIHHPTPQKDANGNFLPAKSKILKEGRLLAKDQDEAVMVIAREIPEQNLDNLSEIQIAIAPF